MNEIDSWRHTLDGILSNEEYQIYYRDNRNLLQRAWDWIREWVLDLIYEWLGGLSPSSTTGDIIVAILLIVGLFVVLFLGIYLVRNWQVKQRLKTTQPLKDLTMASGNLEDYQKSLTIAEADEDYKRAVRYQFLILLFKLHTKNWLIKETWKTNWDYYQELRQNQKDKAESFYQVAVYFESVTYGNKPVKIVDYQDYVEKIRTFEQEE